jgi:hypothetical protein
MRTLGELELGQSGADHAGQSRRARRWGKRNFDWQFSVGVQQELIPRVSVDASYNRRWWGNFFVTHNRALDASITTKSRCSRDRRSFAERRWLPGDVPDAQREQGAGRAGPLLHDDGGLRRRDALLAWRRRHRERAPAERLLLQGGTSTGRGVNDTCDVPGRTVRPSDDAEHGDGRRGAVIDGHPPATFTEPWLTAFRGLATYTVPKVDVLVSAILRSQFNAQPGADVATNGSSRDANYQLNAPHSWPPPADRCATGVATETVNLLPQGSLYGDRVNNLDVRFAKILRFGKTRTNVGIDLYNIFNSNTPTTYEAVYDPSNPARWFQPTVVVQPRFMRFNVQFDY